jgi:hypothetical protein
MTDGRDDLDALEKLDNLISNVPGFEEYRDLLLLMRKKVRDNGQLTERSRGVLQSVINEVSNEYHMSMSFENGGME